MDRVAQAGHVRRDGSPCRCIDCERVSRARTHGLPRARLQASRRPLHLPCAERSARAEAGDEWEQTWVRKGLVGDGFADWLSPIPWALQFHANAADPLGAGSWRYVLCRVCADLERRLGLPVVGFGVTQPNGDRGRQHLHALIATADVGVLGMSGRDAMLQLDRWRGEGSIGIQAKRLIEGLHAVARPYEQMDNAARVRLVPVVPWGAEDDPWSLVRYIARYLLRVDEGDWIEAGDLQKVLAK
jgi:hypothetical protein